MLVSQLIRFTFLLLFFCRMADTNYVLFFPENCPTGNKTKETNKKNLCGERMCVAQNRWDTKERNGETLIFIWARINFQTIKQPYTYVSGWCLFWSLTVATSVLLLLLFWNCSVTNDQCEICSNINRHDNGRNTCNSSCIPWDHVHNAVAHFLMCVCVCVSKMACEVERREVSKDSTAVQIDECSGLGWVSSMFPAGSGITEQCRAAGEHTTATARI